VTQQPIRLQDAQAIHLILLIMFHKSLGKGIKVLQIYIATILEDKSKIRWLWKSWNQKENLICKTSLKNIQEYKLCAVKTTQNQENLRIKEEANFYLRRVTCKFQVSVKIQTFIKMGNKKSTKSRTLWL